MASIFEWFKKLFGGGSGAKVIPMPVKVTPPSVPASGSGSVFDKAFAYTLGNEGGYSNVPEDHGGPTNWGIIEDDLSAWRKHPVTAQDIKDLSQAEAKEIYRARYWSALRIEEIVNEHVAMALFDRAVLNGLTGVSIHVREVLGAPEDHRPNFFGLIPDVNSHDPHQFVWTLADVCESAHRARVKADPSQARFLAGWLNRCERMRKELG